MSRDLTIQLGSNQPGAASGVAETIGSASINMEGFAEVEGVVHVLLADDDVDAARGALSAAGLAIAYEHEVEIVTVEDRPGGLAELTRKIAEAGVNLRFVYLASGTRVVFGAEDPAALRKALG